MYETPILLTPDDFIYTMIEKESEDFLFVSPHGLKLVNEMGDVYYHKDVVVPYHEHKRGYETFMIDRGSVLVTINGKRCTIGEGDIMHIEPHVSHEFTYLEEGTIWREIFHGMDLYGGIYEKNMIFRCFPGMLEDPAAMAKFRARQNSARTGQVEPEIVPKEQMPQVRAKGGALRSFSFDGITCNLKVGRWEIAGECEMWELVFDRDMVLEWKEPNPEWSLYVVREGQVEVTAATKTYIAKKRDILHIPPYVPHTFRMLDENTTIHALYCKSQLLHLLEELDLLRSRDPELLKDDALLRELMRKHKCFVTGFRKIRQ